MKRGYAIAAGAVTIALAAGACSAGSLVGGPVGSNGAAGFSPGGSGPGTSAAADASNGALGSPGLSPPPLPPEMKSEGAYQTPVATRNIVWIANPTSGRVAYIDAQSFSVQTIEAGNGPTYVAAIPDPTDDVAIVQNVLSQNATLLRHYPGMLPAACPSAPNEPKSTPINGICATPLASTRDANAWAVSASGRWAIAWTDTTRISNADPTQAFSDVAVLDLSLAKTPTILGSAGYRPVKVAFSADDAFAYTVSDDGIAVIDLLGGPLPKVVQTFPLAAPPTSASDAGSEASSEASDSSPSDAFGSDSANDASDSAAEGAAAPPPVGPVAMGPPVVGRPDVSFTPDGSLALVRNEGFSSIEVVSLKDGKTTSVPLPSVPTDLTISPKGDFAVAVLRDRDSSAVAILPVPGIVGAPDSVTTIPIPGETVGRGIVTKDGKSVLLFTTAAPIERLTVLTLASPSLRTVTLHAPVLAVFPTDDGQDAVVLHNVTPAPGSNVKGAFTIVPIAMSLPAKIVSLPATPIAVALSPASDRALISLRDDSTSTFGAYLAMMPSLEVRPYVLASPPIAVGIAAGTMPARGYIAQDYAEGRITFVDLTGGAERTITGFELGARIVPGSKP